MSAPPVLPPKTGSHETSRLSTPAQDHLPPRLGVPPGWDVASAISAPPSPPPAMVDPGELWLPLILEDKSTSDLADILSNPTLLEALTHSSQSVHPSLGKSREALLAHLAHNVEVARVLAEQETRLSRQRSATQAQLLSTHALERQWRQKQSDMDHALAPFSPASLYQRLAQGVQEQAAVCQAMEESFLEGDGQDGEREAADWVRRYREVKVLYYLRQERKERWDEGRVGGWR